MRKITRGLATAAVAAALVAGPSAAAFAYTPVAPAPGTSAVAGGVTTLNFSGFAPNSDVTIVITGENASGITLASTVSFETTSDAAGNASIDVRLPADASGSYAVVATDAEGNTVATTVAAVAADAADDDAEGLANTGAESAAAFWFAGGLLALGATTVITLNVVRRNRAAQA